MGVFGQRSWIGLLVIAGCATPSAEATAPIATVSAAPIGAAGAAADASGSATARAAAPPIASSAPVGERAANEGSEAVLRCRQQRCAKLGKACFDNCYKHGHLADPEGHERCNAWCRASSGVAKCEAECERTAAGKEAR